ncbi:JAB-like toxin 1 domain-containing protein [Flavobacterium sp.]|uniref:JAB-like toxin 1 domain-containing protein n=1 Tax=Flavobacterium sp. TaxID=239 RepID=UPI00374D606C
MLPRVPDGMDIYLLTESGRTILALKEKDKTEDTMYAVKNDDISDVFAKDGKKTLKPSFFTVKDYDGAGKFSEKDGIKVKSGIIGQMINSSGKIDGKDYYSSKSEYSEQNENNYLNIFKFASDNSTSEFGMHTYNSNGKKMIQLSTNADEGAVTAPIGFGIKNSDVINRWHSHPSIRTNPSVEKFSIQGNTGDSDYGHSFYQKRNYNYIYFPNSSRLYNVTPTTINYIKQINNHKDLKN